MKSVCNMILMFLQIIQMLYQTITLEHQQASLCFSCATVYCAVTVAKFRLKLKSYTRLFHICLWRNTTKGHKSE